MILDRYLRKTQGRSLVDTYDKFREIDRSNSCVIDSFCDGGFLRGLFGKPLYDDGQRAAFKALRRLESLHGLGISGEIDDVLDSIVSKKVLQERLARQSIVQREYLHLALDLGYREKMIGLYSSQVAPLFW